MGQETFDYVVIGAGSAGCVVASRLSEDGSAQVALLEAGPADSSALVQCPAGIAGMAKLGHFNWALQTVPQAGLGGRRGYQPRGKVLGGSSAVNAMIYLRGQPKDYDWWASRGNEGWGWEDVQPWFLKSENNSRGSDEFHAQGGPLHVSDLQQPNPLAQAFVDAGVQAGYPRNPDFNGLNQEGFGLYQVTQKNGERCSAAKAFLHPYLDRANLHIKTGAQVLRIVLEEQDGGWRAAGVEYQKDGVRHTVMARREVVLSAGALLSPQVLMLSGIGPAAHLYDMGIEPRCDLPGVGRNLHDHLDATLVMDGAHLRHSFGLSVGGVWNMVQGALQWRRDRTGLLTTNFAEGGAFIRSDPYLHQPDLQLHFVVGKLIDHGRKTVWGHGYSCHVCVLQPLSRGSVRLASGDPLVPPRIDPNFLAEAADVDRMVRGVQIMRRVLAQPSLAKLRARELPDSAAAQTPKQIEAWVRKNADSIYHPVGTCRMGNDEQAVVDNQLRVRGVQGLRVVDASVFPRITSGNTNAPTIMLAEKAAQLIMAPPAVEGVELQSFDVA